MNFEIKPFVAAAFCWGILGALALMMVPEAALSVWHCFGLFWILSLLSLFIMAKLFFAMNSSRIMKALFWGGIKILILGIMGGVIWLERKESPLALLLGLATMMVVPLAGGLWWSKKGFTYA